MSLTLKKFVFLLFFVYQQSLLDICFASAFTRISKEHSTAHVEPEQAQKTQEQVQRELETSRRRAKRSLLIKNGYTPLRHLGAGSYADVYAVESSEQSYFAAKVFKGDYDLEYRGSSAYERRILAHLDAYYENQKESFFERLVEIEKSLYFVQIKETIVLTDEETNEAYSEEAIIYELMTGDLQHLSSKLSASSQPGLSLKQCRDIATSLFETLKILNKAGIIHTDIKPNNILYKENQRETLYKLSDYGASIFKDRAREYEGGRISSRYFRAPEISLGFSFDESIDMWSVGITLLNLHTGKLFLNKSSSFENLRYLAKNLGWPQSMVDKIMASEKFNKECLLMAPYLVEENEADPVAFLKGYIERIWGIEIAADNHDYMNFIQTLAACLALDKDMRLKPKDGVAMLKGGNLKSNKAQLAFRALNSSSIEKDFNKQLRTTRRPSQEEKKLASTLSTSTDAFSSAAAAVASSDVSGKRSHSLNPVKISSSLREF